MFTCDQILLVDGSDTVRQRAHMGLACVAPDVDLISAASAAEARLLRANPTGQLGFVLIDSNTPTFTATLDFLRWRKVTEPWPQVPVLVMGNLSRDQLEAAHKLGANCMSKPESVDEWAERFNDLLNYWCGVVRRVSR